MLKIAENCGISTVIWQWVLDYRSISAKGFAGYAVVLLSEVWGAVGRNLLNASSVK